MRKIKLVVLFASIVFCSFAPAYYPYIPQQPFIPFYSSYGSLTGHCHYPGCQAYCPYAHHQNYFPSLPNLFSMNLRAQIRYTCQMNYMRCMYNNPYSYYYHSGYICSQQYYLCLNFIPY